MFDIIVGGITVDTVLAWDRNDATVYASRKYGPTAVVRRSA